MSEKKADQRLQIGYGSAWHLLRCLGWNRERFTAIIAKELGASSIHWLDFPTNRGNGYYPKQIPIRDGEWKRLQFIDDKNIKRAYGWPTQGNQQTWDLIGKAMINGQEEWILLEAKAHAGEIVFRNREPTGGRAAIRKLFLRTIEALGHEGEEAGKLADTWLTGCYQYANRLTTLQFLVDQKVPARLVFLYFCGDKHSTPKLCHKNAKEWQPIRDKVKACLGLTGKSELEKRVHDVFVDVDLK